MKYWRIGDIVIDVEKIVAVKPADFGEGVILWLEGGHSLVVPARSLDHVLRVLDWVEVKEEGKKKVMR